MASSVPGLESALSLCNPRRAVPFAALVLIALVSALGAPAPASADGIFLAQCTFSHRASDDPIVFHGMPGKSHSHDFLGNRSTTAASTRKSLNRSTSTCKPAGDESAYWVPTLYKDGRAITPKYAQFYYQDYFRKGWVLPFPTGLRMVAGNMKSKGPQPGITRWTCEGDNHGKSDTIPTDCSPRKGITVRVTFPDCWDGKRLDSRNHKSHMAYNTADGKESGKQECPTDHPVVVPQLVVNVTYPVHDGTGVSLASGSTYSAHADFFNAWKPSALKQQVDDVLNGGRSCHVLVGCADTGSPNTGEPVMGRPSSKLVDRFFAPTDMSHAFHALTATSAPAQPSFLCRPKAASGRRAALNV